MSSTNGESKSGAGNVAAVAAAGSVLTALLTASPCLIPLGAIVLGVSGFGFLFQLTPLREPASIATALLLAVGFWSAYRRAPTTDCAARRRQSRTFIWTAAGIAAVLNVLEYVVLPNLA